MPWLLMSAAVAVADIAWGAVRDRWAGGSGGWRGWSGEIAGDVDDEVGSGVGVKADVATGAEACDDTPKPQNPTIHNYKCSSQEEG